MSFQTRLSNLYRPTIEDDIGPEQYMKLREDLVRGDNDRYWLESYCNHGNEIFAILIQLNTELTRDRIRYFLSKGVDVNMKVAFSDDEDNLTYPILKTIENRNYKSSESLINCCANLDVKDSCGFNALELALVGKELADREDVYGCEKLVALIDRATKVENTFTIASWIVEECCESYKKHSKYLRDVIELCGS